MYTPTAKGYFSGCGGMEIGIMQAGVKVIQSLDLDIDAWADVAPNAGTLMSFTRPRDLDPALGPESR